MSDASGGTCTCEGGYVAGRDAPLGPCPIHGDRDESGDTPRDWQRAAVIAQLRDMKERMQPQASLLPVRDDLAALTLAIRALTALQEADEALEWAIGELAARSRDHRGKLKPESTAARHAQALARLRELIDTQDS